jgi:endoglucanase
VNADYNCKRRNELKIHVTVLTIMLALIFLPAGVIASTTSPQPAINSSTTTSGGVGTVITATGSGFTGAKAAGIGAGHDSAFKGLSDTQAQITVLAAATPTLRIHAISTFVPAGKTTVLIWSSTNATSCTASGNWSGSERTSGTKSELLPTAGKYTYMLTCSGIGGSASASATVTATAPSNSDHRRIPSLISTTAPTVTISASPSSVTAGKTTTLTWSSTNATSCTASGNWSGSETTSGAQSEPLPTAGKYTYTLTCAGTGGSANASATVTANAATISPLSLSVQGNKIVDVNGNTFQLRGVNMSGLEFTAIQGWDPSDPTGGQFGQPNSPNWSAVQAWKINVVRFPLNQSSWLGTTCYDLDGNAINPDPGGNYRATVERLVNEANAAGIRVILDLHWSSPGNYCPFQQDEMADADNSLNFWTSVATTFKGNNSVIFDLFNEPYFDYNFGGNLWTWMMQGTGGNFSAIVVTSRLGTGPLASQRSSVWWEDIPLNWKIASFQDMINAVRATGATNIVMVGSNNYNEDFSGWWANRPTDPLNQMVAAVHAYPNGNGTWANPCSSTNDYCSPWYAPALWTELQAIESAGIPVVFGETGDQCSTGTVGAPMMSNVLRFADNPGAAYSSTEMNIQWPAVSGGLPPMGVLAWTWNPWSCGSSVLITSSGAPTPGEGAVFQSWLVNHK